MTPTQSIKKAFLDASILIDIVEDSAKGNNALLEIEKYDEIFCSVLGLLFTKRHTIKLNTEESLNRYNDLVTDIIKCEFNYEIFKQGEIILEGVDLEDAVQLATSQANKCNAFLTADKDLYKKYKKQYPVILIKEYI